MRRPLISRRTALASGLAMSVARAARASTLSTLLAEDGRPIRLSTWAAVGPERGLILFSHGALSSPDKYENLLRPWSLAGFRILAPLHVDSTEHPDHAKYGMIDSWRCRLLDMRAVAAFARADHFIAAGHSYGALTALTLGGARAEIPPGFSGPLRDPRAAFVVAFSPPGWNPGLITAEGYADIAVPALIETGDQDVPFDAKDGRWQSHLAAYEMAPPGDKYALVLAGVDHYFGGLICSPERPGPRQAARFADAVAVSTTFLQAYAGDAAARGRLDHEISDRGPVQLMRK